MSRESIFAMAPIFIAYHIKDRIQGSIEITNNLSIFGAII